MVVINVSYFDSVGRTIRNGEVTSVMVEELETLPKHEALNLAIEHAYNMCGVGCEVIGVQFIQW